jgi:hypothetical protein
MAMSNATLTQQERDLAETANWLAEAVEMKDRVNPGVSGIHGRGWNWAEDHTPPDSDDDVLTSILYTDQGDSDPAAGFTLWRGPVAYRVRIEPVTS